MADKASITALGDGSIAPTGFITTLWRELTLSSRFICGPMFILLPDASCAAADKLCKSSEHYMFMCFLSYFSSDMPDAMTKLISYVRIPISSHSGRQKTRAPQDAGPVEFNNFMNHAAYVVTDAFHAEDFGSTLQMSLTIVIRECGASKFSRVESLLETHMDEEKAYGSITYHLKRAGDYDCVLEGNKCEKFATYLEGWLNG